MVAVRRIHPGGVPSDCAVAPGVCTPALAGMTPNAHATLHYAMQQHTVLQAQSRCGEKEASRRYCRRLSVSFAHSGLAYQQALSRDDKP